VQLYLQEARVRLNDKPERNGEIWTCSRLGGD
jgi:hypothetical protein